MVLSGDIKHKINQSNLPNLFSADWNLRSLFGRSLHDSCPLAEQSKIYVDTTLHQVGFYMSCLI